MKNFATGIWHGIGTTGRILVACTAFYFICKTFGKS